MALIDRILGESAAKKDEAGGDKPAGARTALPPAYHEIKSKVHNRLFDFIDFSRIGEVTEERVAGDIAVLTRRILSEENTPFTHAEREMIVEEVQHEVFGLGPLEPLLKDPTISDILVNGPNSVYVERSGRLQPAITQFKDNDHLMRVIEKILTSVGRRIDELTPYADARLLDGSRVHAIIPPLAIDGPTISVRRFAADPLTHRDLIGFGTVTEDCVKILEGVVKSRLNVLISGGTGSGKTTLLNVMSGFIPEQERVITIEDSAELQLKQEHVVRLETRPANVEGKGEVTQRDLLINTLRMRPDRIVIGEVRGNEAVDMLQAMNTGQVAMSGIEIPRRAVQVQIASAIDVVIQLSRFADGRRRVLSVMEVQGVTPDSVAMVEIFRFDRREADGRGETEGELVATGERPHFLRKFDLLGYDYPEHLFTKDERELPDGSGYR
ncbi:MAG: CpaF family protein [Deltaproteobacteria bacterium]|nr:CpaF family protein [Deltaproteobacteria bacterium]